jgi:AcrR family transcriptional regulator
MATKSKPTSMVKPPRPRVRRGNADDAEQLRGALIDAASALFAQGGLEAVTMRSVAARVGVSAMTPYHYFADKAELLSSLWQFVIQALHDHMIEEANRHTGGRAQLRASIDTFIGYWETHPDHYRLVYMTERTAQRENKTGYASAPIYARIIDLIYAQTAGLATEIGADPARVRMATDVRFAMAIGYLHTTLITRRYPWSDEAHMRELYIDQIMLATERCLIGDSIASVNQR